MSVEPATKLKRVVPRREESRSVDRHEPSSTRFLSINAIANVAVAAKRLEQT